MRYSAPVDVTAVSLAAGEFTVTDGFVDLPDDLGEGDLHGLAANGFAADPSDADVKRVDKARKARDDADAELAAAIEAEQAEERALEATAAAQAVVDAEAAAAASGAAAIPAVNAAPPADPGAPAADQADEVAVSIVNLGFGKYQHVNAAGERFGAKIKKAEAEASGLPIAKA